MQRPIVVLPQPLSPTRPKVSPRRIVRSTPSTAFTSPILRRVTIPSVIGKCMRRPRTSTSGPAEFCPRELSPREFGPREFGPREFGPREFGPREFGPREFGPREFGPREFGPREFGPREFGPREFGPREFGPREFGPREFGPREFGPREFCLPAAMLMRPRRRRPTVLRCGSRRRNAPARPPGRGSARTGPVS